MKITLNDINKTIESYFTPEDESPILCHISTLYMALSYLQYEIEEMTEEYYRVLPEDFKDVLAQVYHTSVLLQDMLK